MPDNIAYQPGSGNWIIQDDGEGPDFGHNNDIRVCTDDGQDSDDLADACARIITLNDLSAETTGGAFDATGTRYLLQRSTQCHRSWGFEVIDWKNVN